MGLYVCNTICNVFAPGLIRFGIWCSTFYILCSPLAMWMYILYQFMEGVAIQIVTQRS